MFAGCPQSCCLASQTGWRFCANAVPLVVASIARTRTRAESRLARPVTTSEGVAVPMPGRNPKHSSKTRLDPCADAGNPAKVRGALRKTSRATVHNSARRSNCALTATTIVLSDMRTALIAPGSTMPHENSGRERNRKDVVSGRPPEVLKDLSVGGFGHRDDPGYVTGIASNENHVARFDRDVSWASALRLLWCSSDADGSLNSA